MLKLMRATRARRIAGIVILPLLAASFLAGCQAARHGALNQASAPTMDTPPSPGFGGLLPRPSELAALVDRERLASYTEEDLIDNGRDYVDVFGHAHVQKDGDVAYFTPLWSPSSGLTNDHLAYCQYYFGDLEGYNRTPQIRYGWEQPPEDIRTAWLGVSHWGHDSYVWFQCNAVGVQPLSSMHEYLQNADIMWVAFVLANDDESRLRYVRLGEQQLAAQVDTSPQTALAPASVSGIAAGSACPAGDIVKYEWDFDNDGVFEEDSGTLPVASHTYDSVGEHTLAVRVTSSFGVTDTASATATLIGPWLHTWGGGNRDELRAATPYYQEAVFCTGLTCSYGADEDDQDMILLKYDYLGGLEWARVWAAGGYEVGQAIISYGGDIYVLGDTDSFGAGGDDIFLQRWTTDGNLLWTKTWGGDKDDNAATLLGADDSLWVLGNTRSFGAGSGDIAFLRFGLDGALLLERTWGGTENESAQDMESSVVLGPDNRYFHISGITSSLGSAAANVLYLQLGESGDVVDVQTWPQTALRSYISVYGMFASDIFIASNITSPNRNILLLRVNPPGDPVAKIWGGTGSEEANGLIRVSDGLIVTGWSNSFNGVSGLLLNLSLSGGVQGAKVWTHAEEATSYGVGPFTGSGVLLTGRAYDTGGAWVQASGNLSDASGSWETHSLATATPAGTVATSPSGELKEITDGVADTGGGYHDCLVTAARIP